MKRIIDGVYTFTGLIAGRVYCLEGRDGLTLIDAGIPPSGKKILKQLGSRVKEVRRILITHAHPDHVGGLPDLYAALNVPIFASPFEKRVILGEMPIPRPGKKPASVTLPGTPVDHEVDEGDTLPAIIGDGAIHVLATPGHAPGHISFWQPERRLLFTGDVFFHILSGDRTGLRMPFGFVTVDMELNRKSARRLVDLEPEGVFFGHGQPMLENAADKLRDYATRKLGSSSK